MGRILYVFPHPDDESFGPAPALARQQREGHEVFLLTLTRGEATKQRHRHGFSREEMGAVRFEEMQKMARVLRLTDLTVLDFPDNHFAELNPLDLEEAIGKHIQNVRPEVLVTYAAHGISGHPDHTITHTVVKRVFCSLTDRENPGLRRLALFTLEESDDPKRSAHLRSSSAESIDCVVPVERQDLERAAEALGCYGTYQAVIERHDPLAQVRDGVRFELFQEHFDPPIQDLFDRLPEYLPATAG